MARRSSDSGGFLFKTGIFALLAGVAFWLFNMFGGNKSVPDTSQPASTAARDTTASPPFPQEIIPTFAAGELVQHRYFALGYDEDHEQARWVAYELTRERLNANWAERPNTFRPDPEVRTESATPRDYQGSGYDKGHLCPAADMAFDAVAIDETFLMSNISPQEPAFNGGVWRELEELTRDWARKFKRVFIVTGPVITPNPPQIGFSKVSIPAGFYKVLLAPDALRAIGFIVPNQLSEKPVMSFACSIDKVEKVTNIDFFPALLKGLNEELEASFDRDAWPVNNSRQEQRIKVWNKR